MRRIITSGLGEAGIPAGFSWPTSLEYVQRTSTALSAVKAAGYSVMDSASFPGSDPAKAVLTAIASGQQESLTAVLEAAAGQGLDRLIGPGAGAVASKFIDCMQDALEGDVKAAVVGGINLAGQLAESLSGIPLLGQIAGAVCGLVSQLWEAFAAEAGAKEEVMRLCLEHAIVHCREARDKSVALPTGGKNDVTPADMFRGHLISYRSGAALPRLNVSSMYIAMCGGESQGFGMGRADYDRVLASARQYSPSVGIRPEIQRTMWKLIKGVMFAAEDPRLGQVNLASTGDQGRALFPMLQDILRNEYIRYKQTGIGGWDENLAAAMSQSLHAEVGSSATLSTGYGAGVYRASCDCSQIPNRPFQLDGALISSVMAWQNALKAPENGFWKNGKYVWGGPVKKVQKPRGILLLSKAQSNKIINAGKKSTVLTAPQKAAVAGGAIGGSYLAWEIVRRLVTGGI